jgi:hypothetical protein
VGEDVQVTEGKTLTGVRIKGLVAVANRAREQWSAGLLPAEADAFRSMVSSAIAQVEQICREHRCTPTQLPGPSYRAYQFLRALDLDRLPLSDTPPAHTQRSVRIKNLSVICDRIRTELLALVRAAGPEATALTLAHPGVPALLTRVRSHVDAIETICQQSNSHPASLPARSRSAYQWLKFLSDPDNLLAHIATLALARQIIDRADLSGPARSARRKIDFELYPSDFLYRTQVERDGLRLIAAQGFLGAPVEVLEALVRVAVSRGEAAAMSQVKAYAAGDDFAETLLALELDAEPNGGDLRGRHFDLERVFARVNEGYFGGLLARPRLRWNRTLTQRKMGHYQAATDTVMISITLDDPGAPDYAIDLVMYHELLHKKMGVQRINGRRYAHTETFREEERKFRHYAEARAFLDKLSAGLHVR